MECREGKIQISLWSAGLAFVRTADPVSSLCSGMSRSSHTCAGPNETAGLAGKMRRSISTCIAAACLVLSSLGGSPCGTGGTCSSAGPRATLFADAFVAAGTASTCSTHRHRSTAKLVRPKGSGRSEEEWDAVREERKEQLKEVLCLDQKGVDKLVRANPSVLTHVVENTLPKVAMLQERLEIDQKTAGKILSDPFTFGQSANRILQKIDWLQDRLNLDTNDIAKICCNAPCVLGFSSDRLEDILRFIQSCLDLTDKELANFICRYPVILGINVEEKIPPRMSYLQTRLELDDDRVKEMLRKDPPLLTLATDTIETKLTFYAALLGKKEAKRMVIESTNLLKVSLEHKLKPRLAEVQKLGIKVKWDKTLAQRLARRTKGLWERYKLEDVKTVRQREREQQNDA